MVWCLSVLVISVSKDRKLQTSFNNEHNKCIPIEVIEPVLLVNKYSNKFETGCFTNHNIIVSHRLIVF